MSIRLMDSPSGRFLHLDAATISTMLTTWKTCLNSIATAHQSYTIGSRSFTRADLAEVSSMVADLSFAQKVNGGQLRRMTHVDMSNTPG